MDDIDRLGSLFAEDQPTTHDTTPEKPHEAGLLDDFEERVKARNVVWYIIVMLAATALWSYVWTPMLTYIQLWNDPPEGVSGFGRLAVATIAYTSLCMLMTVGLSAAACARQFRAVFSNGILILAIAAAVFVATTELGNGKAVVELVPFLSLGR